MDYRQSIKNLNHLKNFIRAWDECYIFFFFYSEANYDIEIYGVERTAEQKNRIDESMCDQFPYAYVSNEKSGAETLYYHDKNITVEFDLFFGEVNLFYCYDPVDKKILQQQLSQLIELLKNK